MEISRGIRLLERTRSMQLRIKNATIGHLAEIEIPAIPVQGSSQMKKFMYLLLA
jgi:hypothetical protein